MFYRFVTFSEYSLGGRGGRDDMGKDLFRGFEDVGFWWLGRFFYVGRGGLNVLGVMVIGWVGVIFGRNYYCIWICVCV